MKFQSKRFVVEVKRGTSRAAFSSPDAGVDKFSAAEAMLFGTPAKPASTAPRQQDGATNGTPPRRILESLAEAPPPPVLADEEPLERPRRGRKPGSKNKPKTTAESVAPAPIVLSAAALAFMKAPESAKPAAADLAARPQPEAIVIGDAGSEGRSAGSAPRQEGQRGRLRERSSIIQRYVLGTAPQPGQVGSMRARKLARAAATPR